MTSNSSAGRSISWELHPEPIQDYLLPPSFLPSQKETQKFSVAGQQYLEGMCIRNGRDYNLIKHINSIIYVCVCVHMCVYTHTWVSLVAQAGKNLPTMKEIWVWSPGGEDTLEKEMVTQSSILAWRIPWTEGPGRLQPMGVAKSQTQFSD